MAETVDVLAGAVEGGGGVLEGTDAFVGEKGRVFLAGIIERRFFDSSPMDCNNSTISLFPNTSLPSSSVVNSTAVHVSPAVNRSFVASWDHAMSVTTLCEAPLITAKGRVRSFFHTETAPSSAPIATKESGCVA